MISFGKSAFAAAVSLSLGACATVARDPVPVSGAGDRSSIALSVGPCFGFCPVYSARIAQDGRVSFTGERHTAVLGPRDSRVSPRTYRAIAADLAPYRPASGSTAPIACRAEISDMPSYTITWTDESGRQTVATHRGGCRKGPGHELDAILQALPRRLGIEAWMKQTTRPGVSRG